MKTLDMLRKTLTPLSSPFLLKRQVRAMERCASALENIESAIRIVAGIPGKVVEESPDDDQDLLYSTDTDTWERTERDRRKGFKHEGGLE